MPSVRTPVLFVIFNRPDVTAVTFAEIARARPTKLFIAADGPRPDRPGEAEKCAAARKIVERIDWECEVFTDFSPKNLGSRDRVTSGIEWAFRSVEELIILEDDCSPDPSFFPFCEAMLERYRNDDRVMSIGGTNFLEASLAPKESYYFSSIPLIWGWATWRRAWKKYDVKMTGWPEFRDSPRFTETVPSFVGRLHYRMQMQRVYTGAPDVWDYQWLYSIWKAGGVSIVPATNLIRNIGFGADATHTRFRDQGLLPALTPMPFPLRHPERTISVRKDLDEVWVVKQYHPLAKIKRKLLGLFQQ